jgi:hypothetical protein
MKRILSITLVALLGWTASAWGNSPPFMCLNCGIHCICPPPPACPDCSCPCDQGHRHCSCRKSERAHQLIEELQSACCCDRIKAAHKLGSRLHADFCCDPEVLSALTQALLCDPCWEVRKTAAWSIALQKARTELGVTALYLASRLDPHFLVRDAATDAMDVLLVCRRECFQDLFTRTDVLVASLRGKYKPGSPECVHLLDGCSGGGVTPVLPAPPPPPPGVKIFDGGGLAAPANFGPQSGQTFVAPSQVQPR